MTYVQEGGKSYNVSIRGAGDKFWYLNNKLHREKGPAIELIGGGKAWYFEGNKIACSSQKDFEDKIRLKKEANETHTYDVKIECMVPAVMTYRITAKNPEEALTKTKSARPTNIQYKHGGKRDKKAMVYDAGLSIVRLVKNLVGY